MRARVLVPLLLLSCKREPEPDPDPVVELPDGVDVRRPIVLTAGTLVLETDPAFVSVTVEEDRLVFTFDGAPAAMPEVGAVVLGAEGDGYLRRVTAIDGAGDEVTLTTEPAFLTDAIEDASFSVVVAPDPTEWEDSDGNLAGQPFRANDRNSNAFKLFLPSPVGLSCNESASFDFTPILDVDPELTVDIDISNATLNSAEFVFRGDVAAGYDLVTAGTFGAQCSVDVVAAARAATGRSLKYELGRTTFFIGPVPVVVTHAIAPKFHVDVGMTRPWVGSFSGHLATYGIEIGSTYDGEWHGVWSSELASQSYQEPGDGDGMGTSSAITLAGGIGYSGMIYGVAGPTASIEGDLTGSQEWVQQCEAVRNALTVGTKASVGADVTIPIPTFPSNATIASFSQSWDIARATLYSDPAECPSPDPDPDPGVDPTAVEVVLQVALPGPGATTDLEVFSWDADGMLNLTNDPGQDSGPAWSADGSEIAWVSDRSGSRQIWTMQPDGSAPTQETTDLASPPGDLVFSPDGTAIAFAMAGRIQVLDRISGSVTEVSATDTDRWPAWSPDGTQIAYLRVNPQGGLYGVPADGSAPPTYLLGDYGYPSAEERPLWVSDTGIVIAESFLDPDLLLIHPDGVTGSTALTTTGDIAGTPVLSPDGLWLLHRLVGGGYARTEVTGGTPIPIPSSDLCNSPPAGWSPDGTRMVCLGVDGSLNLITLDGQVETRQLAEGSSPYTLWYAVRPVPTP